MIELVDAGGVEQMGEDLPLSCTCSCSCSTDGSCGCNSGVRTKRHAPSGSYE